MNRRVCKNCRRLFNYIYGSELCPDCIKRMSDDKVEQGKEVTAAALKPTVSEDELKYGQVRDYIMANPRASVTQIAEVNGITPSKLFEWIRDERLEFSDDSADAWFICERCGAKIRSGRLCNRCKIK